MRSKFLYAHVVAAVLHALCALYAYTSPSAFSTPIPVMLNKVTYDGPGYYDVSETISFHLPSVIVIHGIVALVTLCFHVTVYLPCYAYYSHTIWSQGFFAPRWLEYSVTCTLMTLASVASAGTSDFTTLTALLFFGIALQGVGAAIEQRKELVSYLLAVGGFIYVGTLVGTAWHLISAPQPSAVQVFEFIAYGFFYALFPLNCIADARYRAGKFIRTDWFYLVLSVTSKFALFWLQVGETEHRASPGWWPNVQIALLGAVVPLCMLVAGVRLAPTEVCREDDRAFANTLLFRFCTLRLFPPAEHIVVTKIERGARLHPNRCSA